MANFADSNAITLSIAKAHADSNAFSITINESAIVSAQGNSQASPAITFGLGQVYDLISATGTVNGLPATTSGRAYLTAAQIATGAVTGLPATSTGQINILGNIDAQGNVTAGYAVTTGQTNIWSNITAQGSSEADPATTTGKAAGPIPPGPYHMRVKLPSGLWVDMNEHNGLIGIGPDDHHNQVHDFYGPDHGDVDVTQPLAENEGLFWDVTEGKWKPETRLNFRRPYAPGDVYYRDDVVYDSGWTMVANKETTDRAAPQPAAPPAWSIDPDPTWSTNNTTAVVYSGSFFSFSKSGWVRGLRVWVPDVTGDTNYRFVLIRNPNGANPIYRTIEEPILNTNAWTTLAIGTELVVAGEELVFYIDALNSGGTTPFGPYGWNYGGGQQNPPPAGQGWTHNQQETVLWIDKTDLDSVDRTSQLLGLIAGSSITFVDANNPDNFKTYRINQDPTDDGTYITYPQAALINSGGTLPVGATTASGETPLPQPTQYVEAVGHWPANNPDWATVTGFLQYDGVPQVGVDSNAYGVDVQFEEGAVSEDWDVLAVGGAAAVSDGSGTVGVQNVQAFVTTNNNIWTTIHAYDLLPGETVNAEIIFSAERALAADRYQSKFAVLVYNDGGTINDDSAILYELGDTQLDVRILAGVNAIEIQVRGRNGQIWHWVVNAAYGY